jgi:hypothetical protein
MSRFPSHTVESAPDASRPLLQKIAQSSPTGRPLNVPIRFTVKSLKRLPPLDWDEQRRLYGLPRCSVPSTTLCLSKLAFG